MDERPTPLRGVRVIDTAEGRGELCGRLLADLGADVIRVEPPGGVPSRRRAPRHGEISLAFATLNAGKRSVVIDTATAQGAEQMQALLDHADIWIDTPAPGAPGDRRVASQEARRRNPRLVVVSITDFGASGPYREWVADDAILLAMGGVLSRSG